MADVKVNIPGIGEVVATNAASEETLNKILAVMSKTTKAKDPAEGIFKTMVKDYRDQKKAADDFEKSLEGLTEEQKKAAKIAQVNWENSRKLANALEGGRQAVSAVAGTLGSLGKSVISLGAQMATSYDDMAKNPISAAAGQVDTAIDMAKTAVHGVADTAAGVAHAFSGFPVIGPIVSGLGDAAAAAAKAIADLGAEMLHVANDIMSKEFQKSADALDSYTKQGASFAKGMMEMRTLANDAGISLSVLKDAAKTSSESIRAAGLSQGEGTAALAKGFLASTKTIGKSGASLSNEMLALGYNYQEQIEVQASYMSQLRKTGVDLKNLTPEDLARGTREYAQNLKVISDITGQDAKKLLDKAAAETQRASLMNDLDTKQKDAYKNAFAALEKLPGDADKARQALFQIMKTGTTTVIGYTQGPALEMIKNLANGVKSGNMEFKDAIGVMSDSAKEAAIANKGSVGATTDMVKGFGISSEAIDGYSQTQNALLALNSQNLKDMVTTSDKNATAQANLAGTAGSVEQGFAGVTRSAQNAAVAMEGLASAHLGEYAKLLDKTLKDTTESFTRIIDFINNNFKPKTEKNETAENSAKIQEEGLKVLSDPKSSFWEKLGASAAMGAGMSNGGIASGPTSGFLQKLHGSELVVPLQADGTPKTGTDGYKMLMDIMGSPGNVVSGTQSSGATGGTNDFASSLKDIINPIASLTDIVKKLTDGLSKGSNAGASTNTATDMAQQIADDWQSKQYNIMQEMVGHLRDHKDISQKLLYAGM